MKVIISWVFLFLFIISSSTNNSGTYLLSLEQETEFLKCLDEYAINLERDLEKSNACWIEKPTSNVNLYLGIMPTYQMRFSYNCMVNYYSFNSGNAYALLVHNNRIIYVSQLPKL